jgi:Pvc16 N-terminal domain/Carboxypeptidase regulatory-like domain
MLTLLDELLREILMKGVEGLKPAGGGAVESYQVGFAPPDDDWRTYVTSFNRNALNIYLVDLRENRKLRSNERERVIENRDVYEVPAPLRLDCHYLISAWTPSKSSSGSTQPAIEPTRDEHGLIYETVAVLAQYQSLIPSSIYPPNSAALNAWPPGFRNAEIPISLVPPEGFPKLAEFWGTMGQKHPWKPVIYLVVTIPIELTRELAGTMVTTRITESLFSCGKPETAETWIEIGGLVESGSPPQPVKKAWVGLEDAGGTPLQTFTTDTDGRFIFRKLQKGNYLLRVRADGFTEVARNIEVPSETGDYNVKL